MPYNKITIQPGFNTQATPTLNEGGWSSGNLVKFRNGLLEKISGWAKLFLSPAAGTVRAMHAYADLYSNNTLLLGGDGGAQIYANGILVTSPLFQNIGTDVKFSATAGSPTVTVTSMPFALVAGNIVEFPQSVSIGGFILPAKTLVGVLTASGTQFTFALPGNATSSQSMIDGVAKIAWGTYDSSEAHVQVKFYNHGLSPGGTFTFDLETSLVVSVGTSTYDLSIFPGSPYPVYAVVDANTFVISVPAFTSYPVITRSYLEGSVYNGIAALDGPQVCNFGSPPGSIFSYYTSGNAYLVPGKNSLATTPLAVGGNRTLVQVFTPTTTIKPTSNWSIDNFGQYGLFCQAGGPIYQYTPPLLASPGLVNLGTAAPQINQGFFVAMPQAQVIAFGSEATIGGGAQDPLLVRWSDVGNFNFVATVTNEAGSLRLSRGSKCVGGIQAPLTSLIWTDVDLWSMQYVGVGNGGAIYSFNILGSGCGLIAQNARCVLGSTTFWMGQQTFWTFGGSGVVPVECPLWDIIWNNLNTAYASKIVAAADSTTQEVIFFYPSMASTGENDSYVKYQTIDNLWDYGSLPRTSWIDQSVFGGPLGTDTSYFVQQHEVGSDSDGAPIAGAFAETGFFDISSGDAIMFFDLIIPDFKWFGTNGYVMLTLWATQTPGGTPTMYGPFPVTPTTGIVSTGGIRARQIALRIDWGLAAGFNARVGAIRARTAPSGRV